MLVHLAGGSGTFEDRKEARRRWESWCKDKLCPADREKLKRKSKRRDGQLRRHTANTAEQTAAVLASTPHRYRAYTDGGCDGNGSKGVWGASGWGAHVMEVGAAAHGQGQGWCYRCDAPPQACVCELDAASAGDFTAGDAEVTARADLWGPVVTNGRAPCFFGADKGTNNTGEITGVIQVLLWLMHCAGDGDAIILCDSCYAMDAIEDRMVIRSNVKLIAMAQSLLAQAREQRTVTFTHVKGHSTDGGNSRADELVQWGKLAAPFSQLDRDGTIEGTGAHRPEPDYEDRMARRKAAAARCTAAVQGGGAGPGDDRSATESPEIAAAQGQLEGTVVRAHGGAGWGGDDTPQTTTAEDAEVQHQSAAGGRARADELEDPDRAEEAARDAPPARPLAANAAVGRISGSASHAALSVDAAGDGAGAGAGAGRRRLALDFSLVTIRVENDGTDDGDDDSDDEGLLSSLVSQSGHLMADD